MERQTRDKIVEMLLSVQKGIEYTKASSRAAMLIECIAALQSIAEVCKADFSAERYSYYGEIFDGMIAALSQSRTEHLDGVALAEACDLSLEILRFTIGELKRDKEVKKEILFLPYKASMWDSLESIWMAAVADKEHCNAYVVPIPYCDRNPDGTAKEWHCEINLFPQDVPVLDYRAVDLEKMHPDVIFIHNPYDNNNAATSVSSEYYSRNIKPYTDLLVYVPYFVTGDTIAEHFCQAPGIVNADKVIVESEIIKEQYERYYPGGNPPKDKFLALGSPKYDKVCGTRREDYVLPEKWQKLIGDKKVILYNTSITAMLQHADKFNAKLRYVFAAFKKRDDVALWWRPHPLLKAAMNSITPAVSAAYHQIEQQYIDEGWGIYDDTPEMDRAIVCTDAYYGDMSSLVWLYQKTGKPTIWQDITAVDCDGYLLEPAILEVWENRGWFISRDINALFEVNMQTNMVQLLMSPDPKKFLGDLEYYQIKKCGDKLIIAPFFSDKGFIEYDLIQKSYVEKPLALVEDGKQYKMAFSQSIQCGRYTYFIGYEYPAIVEYDEKNGQYRYYNNYVNNLKRYFPLDNFPILNGIKQLGAFFLGAACVGDFIYLPFCYSNLVVGFDMTKKIFHYYEVGAKDNRYCKIIYDGRGFWLNQVSAGRSIVYWDHRTEKCIEYDKYPVGCDFSRCLLGYNGFVDMVFGHDRIIMFPDMSNMVVEVDIHTGIMTENLWLTSLISSQQMPFKWFGFLRIQGDMLYALCCWNHEVVQIDLKQHTITYCKFLASENIIEKIYEENSQFVVSSNGLYNESVLKWIMNNFNSKKMNQMKLTVRRLSGKTIYENLYKSSV